MTDFYKDISADIKQRIRSPLLSSIVFAFVASNWQALFYLCFADSSVMARLTYFTMKTSTWSLYWRPLLLGTLIALIIPFIKPAFALLIRHANRWLHEIQTIEATQREVVELKEAKKKVSAEADLAVTRVVENARVATAEENAKFEATKRDVKVQSEFDTETANRLQEQIDELRERPVEIKTQQGRIDDPPVDKLRKIAAGLSESAIELLMAAVQAGGLKTQSNFSGDTVFAGNQSFSDESISFLGSSKYIYALEDLTKRGLVKSLGSTIDGTTYEVRERGYEIADMIRDRNL